MGWCMRSSHFCFYFIKPNQYHIFSHWGIIHLPCIIWSLIYEVPGTWLRLLPTKKDIYKPWYKVLGNRYGMVRSGQSVQYDVPGSVYGHDSWKKHFFQTIQPYAWPQIHKESMLSARKKMYFTRNSSITGLSIKRKKNRGSAKIGQNGSKSVIFG